MSNRDFTIKVDGSMLPALIDALSLAASTAMMHFSEDSRKDVQAAFEGLARGLLDQMGLADAYKINAYQWFGACKALRSAKTYFVFIHKPWSWHDAPNRDRDVSLIVDDVEYRIFDRSILSDGPEVGVAITFFEQAQGMDCIRAETIEANSRYEEWLAYRKAGA